MGRGCGQGLWMWVGGTDGNISRGAGLGISLGCMQGGMGVGAYGGKSQGTASLPPGLHVRAFARHTLIARYFTTPYGLSNACLLW